MSDPIQQECTEWVVIIRGTHFTKSGEESDEPRFLKRVIQQDDMTLREQPTFKTTKKITEAMIIGPEDHKPWSRYLHRIQGQWQYPVQFDVVPKDDGEVVQMMGMIGASA